MAPVTAGVLKVISPPAHAGPSFVAVGVAGVAFTTTVVASGALVQPPTVIVTE